MPREMRKPAQNGQPVFLNCDLDKQLKKDLISWVSQEAAQDLVGLIERCIDSGLKFGASIDAYNECWQASLSKSVVEGQKSTTFILIGRGGNLTQAIQAVLFKHFVMLDGTWENLERKNARKETDWA